MRNHIFLLLSIFNVVISGCSYNIANFGHISTKSLDLSNKNIELVESNAMGKDIEYIIIFPTSQPKIEDGIRDALSKSDADYLTNVSVEYRFFYIPYI